MVRWMFFSTESLQRLCWDIQLWSPALKKQERWSRIQHQRVVAVQFFHSSRRGNGIPRKILMENGSNIIRVSAIASRLIGRRVKFLLEDLISLQLSSVNAFVLLLSVKKHFLPMVSLSWHGTLWRDQGMQEISSMIWSVTISTLTSLITKETQQGNLLQHGKQFLLRRTSTEPSFQHDGSFSFNQERKCLFLFS